jgi:hypothetical protein
MSNTSEPMMRQLLYTDRRKSCALARATTDWMVSHWEEGGTTQCLCDQTYLFLWKPQLLLKLTTKYSRASHRSDEAEYTTSSVMCL